MSSETHPISFHEQREPDCSSEIEHCEPYTEPATEQGQMPAVQQEAAGVQAQERLDRERAEAGRPFQEQEKLEQDEGHAHRRQAVPVVASGTQAPDSHLQLVAMDGGGRDEVREKTPPVVAEESEFARQNRQSQELAMVHGHRRGGRDLGNGSRDLDTGRVGERLRDPTQANNPGLSYMVEVLVLYLYMFCIVCILIFYSN